MKEKYQADGYIKTGVSYLICERTRKDRWPKYVVSDYKSKSLAERAFRNFACHRNYCLVEVVETSTIIKET